MRLTHYMYINENDKLIYYSKRIHHSDLVIGIYHVNQLYFENDIHSKKTEHIVLYVSDSIETDYIKKIMFDYLSVNIKDVINKKEKELKSFKEKHRILFRRNKLERILNVKN